MPDSHDTGILRPDKSKLVFFLEQIVAVFRELASVAVAIAEAISDHGPEIVGDSVYRRQTLVKKLGISPVTLRQWVKAGLKPRMPGTSAEFYLGDEVIEFLCTHPTLEGPTKRARKRKAS